MVHAPEVAAAGQQPKPDACQRTGTLSTRRQIKKKSTSIALTTNTQADSARKGIISVPPEALSQSMGLETKQPEGHCKSQTNTSRSDEKKHLPLPLSGEKGVSLYDYTDRFGQLHTISLPNATPKNHSATPSLTESPNYYAFGWAAHPTRASINEICRDFLNGRCQFNESCNRIHPLRRETSISPTSVDKVYLSESPGTDTPMGSANGHIKSKGEKTALQGDSRTRSAGASDSTSRPLPTLADFVKSGTQLRYQPECGIIPYQSIPENDSGQTSDDSQYSVKAFYRINFASPLLSALDQNSPQGSLSTLTSEDDDAANTSDTTRHPPPPSKYFCRHWLEKRCKYSYDCRFIHGNLDYDPPLNGIYPAPQSRELCSKWQKGKCARGYLCRFFHGDLDYLKPTGDRNNSETRPWNTVFRVDVSHPPPKSNYFCRKWMLNRCDRGPKCFFYHGDIKYDPPVQGIHPPPPFKTTCARWKINDCFLQYACLYVHDDLDYDHPVPPPPPPPPQKHQPHPPPRFRQTCQLWIRNLCSLDYSCDYVHLDLEYHEQPVAPPSVHLPQIAPLPVKESFDDPPVGQRPPPSSQDTCIQWLRDRCRLRYACKYRHDDLEYDPPNPKVAEAPSNGPGSIVMTEGQGWTVRVHDHAKIRLGPGFNIKELETGFETPWLYLGNIPNRVTEREVLELLHPFGEVADVRLPVQAKNNPSMLVRVRFTTPMSARDASTALHGAHAFGQKISARLPMHVHDTSFHTNATFTNTSVRIRWEAPSRTAYCGYSSVELAEAGMQATQNVFRDRYIHASVHVGLPVVGVVTVRFQGLPLDVNKEDMAWFAQPDDVVWARPNYKDFDSALSSIKDILQRNLELLDFNVQPPPYRQYVQAWAHFATPGDAKKACGQLHGRKPVFTGKTKIFVEHLQSLTFSISASTYADLRNDIQALRRTVLNVRRTAMFVVERPAPMKTIIKLSGEDLKELGLLKIELERILNWETVCQGANIAWDPFFAQEAGLAFLNNIEAKIKNIKIQANVPRRMIRLLGSSSSRSAVKENILAKLTELQARQVRFVALDGWLLGQFLRSDLAKLQEQLGHENIDIDCHGRRLVVRGDDTVYQGARDAVHCARKAQLHPSRRQSIAACPVCFGEVTHAVTLPCGHGWCRECLVHYLISSVNTRYFPLTCLGRNAKCTEHIPLQIARKVLTTSQFDAVVEAAFDAYVQARNDEFHYCPTPDCQQIYRRAPRDTVLQCPSCLLRICPSCHVEAHDGFTCPDPEADNNLFKEWMKNHDVKPCPGCNILIERAEGCNHMTCTRCKTHVCWVCLQTFPGGEGIYDHMRATHGSIGI